MDALLVLLVVFFGFVGIVALSAIIGAMRLPKSLQQTNSQANRSSPPPSEDDSEKQLERDSVEDSEGDGLMLFDDPMFPPEFDDEDDEDDF